LTEPERLRFTARESVLFDPKFSATAYRLYMALDSMSGFKGHCYPNQVMLAKRLGTTDRTFRRSLVELVDLVSVIHRRGAAVYQLKWAEGRSKPVQDARTSMSDLNADARTLVSDLNQESRRRNQENLKPFHEEKNDDDKVKTWQTEQDELAALVLQSTGFHADRKLLEAIAQALEVRGQFLRSYLDDITPRLARLKETPRAGFFLSHARGFGGYSQQKIAPTPINRTPCCRWGTRVDGTFCGDCETGRELRKAQERIQAENVRNSA